MNKASELLVTVYIPTRNRLDLLTRAVNSVLSQTYKNIELIIVDDCSTDQRVAVYLNDLMARGRIKVMLLLEQSGACVARNKAIDLAQGFYITGLDDDDYFEINRIEEFVKYAEEMRVIGREFSFLYANDYKIHSGGLSPLLKPPNVDFHVMSRGNFVNNQVFVELSKLRSVKFDVAMEMWQDWDVWLGLTLLYGKAFNCGAISYYFDCAHEYGRITEKKESALGRTYRYFVKKHNLNASRRVSIMFGAIKYCKPSDHLRFIGFELSLLVRIVVWVRLIFWRISGRFFS